MSRRLFAVASLVTAFTSFASADSVEPHRFSQPPPSAGAPAEADVPEMPAFATRDQVRSALAAARATNLQRFRAYQKAGVFPSNTFSPGKLNVWRDEAGHLCAAATIIRASGQIALVDKVAEQSNFIRLADVKQGPLMDWILTSGFTQDEIAAIQEPFDQVYVEPAPPQPRVVDRGMRKREDARLRAKYRQVEARILKNRKASLEAATDRLMKNPALAAKLVGILDG